MDRYERPLEPADLLSARQDLCSTEPWDAHQVWDTFRNRTGYKTVKDVLLNASSNTCAFCGGGFAQSRQTIEHFIPKSGTHGDYRLVLEWTNLFPACDACQSEKGGRYSSDLLKPDATGYSPELHFLANPDDGSLEPLPGESDHKAALTIKIYGLNRAALKKYRKNAMAAFLQNSQHELLDYAFIKRLFSTPNQVVKR